MGDVLLTVALCVTQLILGFMGVFVALKPPLAKRHKFWIVAFILVGGSGIFLTAWLARRSGDAQAASNSEIHKAQMAATNANMAATDANRAATDASKAATEAQKETKEARAEAQKAQKDISHLITAKSKETNTTITKWQTNTETAVGKLLRPARILTLEQREAIVKILRGREFRLKLLYDTLKDAMSANNTPINWPRPSRKQDGLFKHDLNS